MGKSTAACTASLAFIALLSQFPAATAEELYVVKDGKLIKEGLDWPPANSLFWKDWVHCAGTTKNGLYIVPKKVGKRNNHARFRTSKSALGDCEFTVVFSCTRADSAGNFPNITIADRGVLKFARDGSQVWLSLRRTALPLKTFAAPCPANVYDGKLHSVTVKRIGGKISFYYDGKKVNEQPIDPEINLYIWFDALNSAPKIKTIKLTAERLSDRLTTNFKSAAPILEIYKGTGVRAKPEYGKACRYRIPALAVSKKGTILAFAEARRINGADVGDIDVVVKRSEDNGKTWGPEIVIMDAKQLSVNNPTPVVDLKSGRIWVMMGRMTPGHDLTVTHFISYSDDDGKTWSTPKKIDLQAKCPPGSSPTLPGPGAGIVLERGKHAGRFIVPVNFNVAGTTAPGVIYSDDRGKTWHVGGMLKAGILMVEARAAELLDGSVLFNARTVNKRRGIAILPDGGTKDTKKLFFAKELPDPSCQGAVVRYCWPRKNEPSTPGVLLYSGPDSLIARARGTIFASYDDGKTWPWKFQYYQGPSGYSDIAVLPDGRVIVLFEKDGKSNLGFMVLPPPPLQSPAHKN